ncbi:hypothetical protein JRQ81_012188 [Phrynocephalus forsythii]|uniref:Uncharacterized protein n=1 Tax=Phrynocephalus forsythii TaxID=171643 RepID=A0A9Q0X8M0_9SAUR|nr:hypothetical protein JRQ81_012188 [Phrynocephalus forsythii]
MLYVPKYRRAFSCARFNVMPSAMLEGRFKGTPLQNRTCPCGEGVETLAHVLLLCSFYREVRQELLFPMLVKKPGRSSDFYISLLLGDRDKQVTLLTAKFLAAAIKMRTTMILKL